MHDSSPIINRYKYPGTLQQCLAVLLCVVLYYTNNAYVCFILRVQELELVEDVWRGEAQDLLTQIAQLQEENKSLLTNMSIKDPMSEEDLQRHEGEGTRSKHIQRTAVIKFRCWKSENVIKSLGPFRKYL